MKSIRPFLCVLFFLVSAFTVAPLPATVYGPINIQEIAFAENRAGRTAHGYVEYRFRVTNRDQKAHRVVLSMPHAPSRTNTPTLTRSSNGVEVPPESTVVVRLLQPPVEMAGNHELSVTIDDRLQRDPTPFSKIDQHLVRHGRSSHEIAHVFASQDVPADMRDAFRMKNTASGTASTSGDPELITWLAVVPVEEWSDSWLAYSRFDCVTLTSGNWRELQSRRQSVLTALKKYAEAGGMLCVVGTDWQAPEEWPGSGRMYRAVLGSAHVLEGSLGRAKSQINDFRDLVLEQARVWDTAIGDSSLTYSGPHYLTPTGTSTTMSGNTTLLKSMPVLANYDVNVKLVMILIVVFAILIGPVNIYVLSAMKRRIWLLWTVPLTSLVAGLLVLGVSFAQEGFLRQTSSATCTVLDQRREEAISYGFVGFYSTLTPRGLLFSPETEVTPCLNRGQYGDKRSLELALVSGGSQFFTRGWIGARVPAYFAVRKAESQRKERITFDWSGERPTGVNGLTVPIRHLKVRSPDGVLFQADDVPAGPKFELRKIEGASAMPDETSAMVQLALAQDSLFRAGPGSASTVPPEGLPAGTYLAEIEVWNPFVEPGIKDMKSFRNTTTIFGIFR